ncbi:Hypothetical predicted protein [Olea europaea subsp. europaea]|uniref:Uncharacterized protein n=1 Tax=Olea europaea subsp. europaea TaxID=158383 RepID=A0A8S0VM74_OLEEU|nr:Hypothetical predicted protein [Olea europaea subsp. europaea]
MNWMRPSQYFDRDHSFTNDRVFGTEGDNHEKVENEVEEFEVGNVVRETVVGALRWGLRWEIGRETIVKGNEREARTREEAETLEIERERVARSIERRLK